MNPQVQKLWTDALRSGKYKQGKYALRTEDEFCCLGVLCDLAVQNGVNVSAVKDPYTGYYRYDNERLGLPKSVREWAGIMVASPTVSHPFHGRIGLTNLNDGGEGFDSIADRIENEQ